MDGDTEITSAAGQRSINDWEFPYTSRYLCYWQRELFNQSMEVIILRKAE